MNFSQIKSVFLCDHADLKIKSQLLAPSYKNFFINNTYLRLILNQSERRVRQMRRKRTKEGRRGNFRGYLNAI